MPGSTASSYITSGADTRKRNCENFRPSIKVKDEFKFKHSDKWAPSRNGYGSSSASSSGSGHDERRKPKRRRIVTVRSDRSESSDSVQLLQNSGTETDARKSGSGLNHQLNLEDSTNRRHEVVSTWVNELTGPIKSEEISDPDARAPSPSSVSISVADTKDDDDLREYVTPCTCAPMMSKGLRLRPIIIDGNSLAWWHGRRIRYSAEGIRVCVDFFQARGHSRVTVFIPDLKSLKITVHKKDVLEELRNEGILRQIPNSIEDGNRVALLASHDNRKFILQRAAQSGAAVISNEDYQALKKDARESWMDRLNNGILNFAFSTVEEIKFRSDRPPPQQWRSVEELLAFP